MSSPTILVVDDDPSLRITTSFILKHKGFEVQTASNAIEAIHLLKGEPFDVVLMDIRMPEINGVEAFEEINKIRPDSAVVLMTAYTVDNLVKKALKSGAKEVLRKPLDIDYLLELLDSIGN